MFKNRKPVPLPTSKVIDDIISAHNQFRVDWLDSRGWAPDRAANLLARSRLDRLCSLAESLRLWFRSRIRAEEQDGNLILAWANLGALLEGSMKFFLSIWIVPYLERISSLDESDEARFLRSLRNHDDGSPREPDGLMLEKLRQFFNKEVWKETVDRNWSDWVCSVAQCRNAIHAYQDRDIASLEQFEAYVRMYARFLTQFISARLPEPPDRFIDG